MKTVIFWCIMATVTFVLHYFLNKGSFISDVLDQRVSSIWTDVLIILICAPVIIVRLVSFCRKVF